MNKKQGVIIVTLLVLIVLAGVLATRLNGNQLYVTENGGGKATSSLSTSDKNTGSEYFAELKISRDQSNSQTLQTLKTMIDDKNVSDESKKDAEKKYESLAMTVNYEQKIEMDLKVKGYADALCSITDNKATVTISTKDQLTDKQIREIKDVVMKVASIKDVDIQVK